MYAQQHSAVFGLACNSAASRRGAPSQPSALLVPPVTYDRAVVDFLEEVVGDIVEPHVAGDLVSPRGGNRLRDVRVGVQAPQLVTAEREWVDEALLLESVADPRPAVVVGGRGEIVQRRRRCRRIRS